MNSDIATIERLLLNSIPARQTILLDQWMIRLNDKFTYRANCACPIFFMDSQQLQKEIHDCERIFNYNCMPTVIKVTPDLQDNVEDILVNLNYCKIKTVNVMVCDITNSHLTVERAKKSGNPHKQCVPDFSFFEKSAYFFYFFVSLKIFFICLVVTI